MFSWDDEVISRHFKITALKKNGMTTVGFCRHSWPLHTTTGQLKDVWSFLSTSCFFYPSHLEFSCEQTACETICKGVLLSFVQFISSPLWQQMCSQDTSSQWFCLSFSSHAIFMHLCTALSRFFSFCMSTHIRLCYISWTCLYATAIKKRFWRERLLWTKL